ncbi:6-phosphogluconate phosphatase [Pseudomonas turukhanskensis]|uniref:6-phosphogluconate phosphatase n=1 Tax=Pseudomonas turukhanskensis TaxID=1806536 RepID=A0A9W6K507_9PSED|nr:6-phosphogluconate phosphatase [Pseudomonas turukhanskensis]
MRNPDKQLWSHLPAHYFEGLSSVTIAGLIFDCDGTLVDSERLAAGLLHHLLAEQQVQMPVDEVLRRFRGIPFAQFISELSALHPALNGTHLAHEFRCRSLPLLRDQVVEMPGAVAFVRETPLPICVASNGPRAKIETSLGAVGLLEVFGARIVSAYEVNAWKPSPRLIEHAAGVLGLPVTQCLLVDDSVPGVQAGISAGAQVAGYGDTDFSEFEGLANFHEVRNFGELESLVKRLS